MTPDEIQQMQKAFEGFKTANDELVTQVKLMGTANSSVVEKVDKYQKTIDGLEVKINARMDAEEANKKHAELLDRLEKMEAKFSRKGAGTDDQKEDATLSKKALFKALKYSALFSDASSQRGKSLDEYLGPELAKSLLLNNDTAGGYLAPPEWIQEMLMNVVQYAGIRGLCRQRSTTRQEIQIPKRTGTAAAAWTSETGNRPETQTPTFGMEVLRTHELYAMAKVSKQELEDSAFDLESFLNDEMSEQFAVSEALAFISGNAVGKPEGILTNPDVTTVVSGDASNLLADSLISMYYDIKEPYLVNATWVANRSTLKVIRQLKDGNGQYLWAAGIRTDARPASILDRPYITAPEMDAVGANNYPVLFGDFKKGYMIVDRLVMEMMTDPYTSKATGMIEFSARRRVGGQVILAEAIRKLKISV